MVTALQFDLAARVAIGGRDQLVNYPAQWRRAVLLKHVCSSFQQMVSGHCSPELVQSVNRRASSNFEHAGMRPQRRAREGARPSAEAAKFTVWETRVGGLQAERHYAAAGDPEIGSCIRKETSWKGMGGSS